MKKVIVKHQIGVIEHRMVTEWWTEKEWEDWNKYVEKCKQDGTYGKEVEFVLELSGEPFFDGFKTEIVLDINNTKVIQFKSLIDNDKR